MRSAGKVAPIIGIAVGVLLLAIACGGGKEKEASPTASPAASATVELSPSPQATSTPVVAESPTPVATPTPTIPAPTPTPDLPPVAVAGFLAEPGSGSGEVRLTWTANPEPDIDHYNIYKSAALGEPYAFLASVPGAQDASHQPGVRGTDDYPVFAKPCYFVRAVDAGGHEGARSREYCSKAAGAPGT
jgi:hypothetical protein